MQINFDAGTVAAGQTTRREWGWPGPGSDHNLILQVAHPRGTAVLVTFSQIKERDSNGNYWYGCDIRNEGPADTGFNIQASGI